MQTIHVFDSISRDQKVIRETEDEKEVEYMSAYESDDSEYHGSKKKFKNGGFERKNMSMVIHLFGMNAKGEAVRIDVTGFRPYFYVALPDIFPDYQKIQTKLRTTLRSDVDLIEFKVERKQKLFGYTGGKTFRFVRMSMPSMNLFYTVRKIFLDDKQLPLLNTKLEKFRQGDRPLEVYEANIDPMLRFFHMRDLKTCGWITATGDEVESDDGIRLECDWNDISPCADPALTTAPLLHAFWDVECYSYSGEFPQANPKAKKPCPVSTTKIPCKNCNTCKANDGDPIIQIGTTLWTNAGFHEKHIFVLDGCSPVEGAKVHVCKTEKELLTRWFQFIVAKNVNVFVGYNIFGFDERYVWERLCKMGVEEDSEIQELSCLWAEGKPMKLEEKRLASSALGDNMLYMWQTPGRLRIDLLGHIKRKAQLPSYKLDSVAAVYLSGKLSGIAAGDVPNKWLLKTKQMGDARIGRYVQVLDELGEELTAEKMEIVGFAEDGKGFYVSSTEELSIVAGEAARWAVVKDDVSPQDIFRLHRGSDSDRAIVAAYCVQDCDLTLELYKKLDVFNEAMSMANVCSVPVSYIFTRGQGIKIESLIFKDCMAKSQLIKVLPGAGAGGATDSYEGAIVLDPIPGFYTDSPIGVCDFASLYPSTIISENISHDMLVWSKEYDLDGKLVCVSYGSVEDEKNAPKGVQWTDIEFDILRPDPEDTRKHPVKRKVGTRHCRYAQPCGDEKGSLPQIVAKLLAARKAKREEIKKTDDPFKKALLDAEQNAYKITANSLYGQLGSPTFKIRLQDLAASVTAYGRKQIMFSKDAIEQFYGPEAGDPRCNATVVYGDTDSLFVCFNPKGENGETLEGREAIVATQHLTEEVGEFITGALKAPHDFEYDKTFSPFIIFSKKRYVGNKYEDDPDDFKETSMGIVLKRRDNAPLLKMTYGAAIDRLLNHKDISGAVRVVKEKVTELVEGKMKLSQLTITKSLRSEYKTTPPAHKMLANRIAERDPGNAPASGERIGYVYVKALAGQVPSKLQGDRVETPEWIVKNGLVADAEYYIHHQLYNPLAQLFGLMVEKMPGFVAPSRWEDHPEKLIAQREIIAGDLLFRDGLTACNNSAKREFMKKLGVSSLSVKSGGSSPSSSAQTQSPKIMLTRKAPVDETLIAAEKAAFGAGNGNSTKKTQTSISQFMMATAVMTDAMMISKMKKAKRDAK